METLPALPGNSVSVGAELQLVGKRNAHNRVHSHNSVSFPQQIFSFPFLHQKKLERERSTTTMEPNTLSGNKKNISFSRERKRSTENEILILLPAAHLCNGSNGAKE